MTIERNGRAAIVIGIPLERANVTYFELDPMREVHDALSSVRLALILAGGFTTIVGIGLGLFASRRAVRPLANAAQAARAIADGRLDTRLEPTDDPDLQASRAERDARNNAKLVAMMRGVPHDRRRARFVCTMCVATPDGAVLVETRGEFEGAIVDEPRGAHGFGYDPHLWLADRGMTSAELPPEVKNELSHRGRAVRRLAYLIHHKRIAW